LRKLLNSVGPGIVFAATAVGVSHLVQATRAGADYGLSVLAFVLLANILKYPLFRFAILYSAGTGKTLLEGYRNIGLPALGMLIVSVLIDMFIAASAVSLVAAGVVKSVTGIQLSDTVVVAGLAGIAFMIVTGSRYHLFERMTVVMMLVLAFLALAAALMAMPSAVAAGSEIFPKIDYTPSLILFLIAMAGWMPNPASASFYLSEWVSARREHSKQSGQFYEIKDAAFDINLGYSLSILIAVCFVVLGAVLIFVPGIHLDVQSGSAFADAFLRLFTATFGDWSRVLVGSAAILVMFSTMLALFDGAPRIARRALGFDSDSRLLFGIMFAVQLVGVLIIISLFKGSFRSFIDFATSFSFATTPFIAYYNYRLMGSDPDNKSLVLGKALRLWSWLGIISMALFGVYFFLMRFTSLLV